MKYAAACLTVTVVFAMAGAASGAITLIYEEGPNAGQVFVSGQVTLKVTAFDVGTVYPNLGAAGMSAGYTGVPGAAVGGGVAALDALAPSPAGALPLGSYATLMEDTWGIGKVTRIQDAMGDALWTPAGKQSELTYIFYGEQDFYVEQIDAGNQRIDGVGMRIDIYEEMLPAAVPFSGALGTAGRTAANTYPGATEGVLALSMLSVPGFINAPGIAGGLATEYEADFNNTTLTGDGETYVELIGGSEMARFDTNTFVSPFGLGVADFRIQFDTVPTQVADWLVTADDPVKGYQIPEPATLALLGAGALALIRRRK